MKYLLALLLSSTAMAGGLVQGGVSGGSVNGTAITPTTVTASTITATQAYFGSAGNISTFTSAGLLSVPPGLISAPSISNGGTAGFYWPSASTVRMTDGTGISIIASGQIYSYTNGSTSLLVGADGNTQLAAASSFGWVASGAADNGNRDTSLSRSAAGVVQFGTGSTNNAGGSIKASSGTFGTGAVASTAVTIYGVETSSTTMGTIACNAGTGVLAATATDAHGTFTAGNGAANCTYTFKTAWPKTPDCICADDSSILAIKATASTTSVICTAAVTMSLDNITFLCMGAP